MLIRLGMTLDRAHMDPTLVGKGGIPDVRLMLVRREVGKLIDKAGKLAQLLQLLSGNAFPLRFQLQGRDDGTEVRVAAALAEAVDRPLNLDNPQIHGVQGIGNRAFRIVVGVYPQRGPDLFPDSLDYLDELEGHGAAVGVAQNDAVYLCLLRSLQGLDGIVRICLVPVKEMLGIIKNLRSMFFQVFEGIEDELDVFIQGDA